MMTEGELNDLIRDLELPKNKAELLASRLQQWNVPHHSVKVTTFGTRNHIFRQFFKTPGYFTYCKGIDGLMDAVHMLQRHVLKQSSYTMVISCLPFLWNILPAQKKHTEL
jgi:hypothetical protein